MSPLLALNIKVKGNWYFSITNEKSSQWFRVSMIGWAIKSVALSYRLQLQYPLPQVVPLDFAEWIPIYFYFLEWLFIKLCTHQKVTLQCNLDLRLANHPWCFQHVSKKPCWTTGLKDIHVEAKHMPEGKVFTIEVQYLCFCWRRQSRLALLCCRFYTLSFTYQQLLSTSSPPRCTQGSGKTWLISLKRLVMNL